MKKRSMRGLSLLLALLMLLAAMPALSLASAYEEVFTLVTSLDELKQDLQFVIVATTPERDEAYVMTTQGSGGWIEPYAAGDAFQNPPATWVVTDSTFVYDWTWTGETERGVISGPTGSLVNSGNALNISSDNASYWSIRDGALSNSVRLETDNRFLSSREANYSHRFRMGGANLQTLGKVDMLIYKKGSPTTTFAPYASRGSDALRPGTEISLSCDMADAAIYYTTDGSTPTVQSTLYASPIVVSEDLTLKAIAVAEGFDPSEVVTYRYTVLPLLSVTDARAAAAGSKLLVGGVVTYAGADRVVIGDQDYGLLVSGVGSESLEVGRAVEIVGLKEDGDVHSVAALEVYPGASGQELPAPRPLHSLDGVETSPELLLSRVKAHSVVLGPVLPGGVTVITDADGNALDILDTPDLDGIAYEGCTVHVTGVLVPKGGKSALGVADAQDVELVSHPSRVGKPVPSVASGKRVAQGTVLTFTCPTPGASVKYTFEDPALGGWLDASGGVLLDQEVGTQVTLYVKGVTESGDMEDSEVVELTYLMAKFFDPVADGDPEIFTEGVVNLLEARAVTSGTVTTVGQIVYRYGSATIIEDLIAGDTAALQVSNALAEYEIGDVIKITGSRSAYSGPEVIGHSGSELIRAAAEAGGLVEPLEFEAIPEILDRQSELHSVMLLLKGVTLGAHAGTGSSNMTPVFIGDDSISIAGAPEYPVDVEEGEVVDLLAILSKDRSGNVFLRAGTPELNAGRRIYDVVNDVKPPRITIGDLPNAEVDMPYNVAVDVADNKGVVEESVCISYRIGAEGAPKENLPMLKNAETGKYEFVIPGAEIVPGAGGGILFTVKASDITGLTAISPEAVIAIDDQPQVLAVTPEKGTATGEDKRPQITAAFRNAGAAPLAALTLTAADGQTVLDGAPMSVEGQLASYTPESDLADGKYTAMVVITRQIDGVSAAFEWSFTVGSALYEAYFGQLHAHTGQYSDGSGTLKNALDYIKAIPQADNVRFVAFTDHSNYFDTTGAANPPEALYDISKATEQSRAKWETYTGDMRAFNAQDNGILAIPGFEMTWSGGPGHMNTFNTEGIVSRNNTQLNNKVNDQGMREYYQLLTKAEGSVSQFNHPGTTFGTFANFAYWDPNTDEMITMIEVGNGAGQVNGSGYFPSYEYYTQALDKGWHLAPTNNQDNHKPDWGNSNTARSVVITNSFSEAGILDGMRNMSMYATEDKNLEILYTVDGSVMGSILPEAGETLSIHAEINDPDGEAIGTVEIVVNGGRTAYIQQVAESSFTLDIELPNNYSYYFLRIIQPDSDKAVTAPVWVGEVSKVGITGMTTETIMPVKGEEMKFTASMYNYEAQDLAIDKIEYSLTHLGVTTVLKTETDHGPIVPGADSALYEFTFTPEVLGFVTLTFRAEARLGDVPYDFETSVEFEVLDSGQLVPMAIDAGHNNFYVSGNYANSDAAMIEMAAENGIRVTRLGKGELTYENIKDMKLLVLTVPFKSFGTSVADSLYTEAELDAIKQYADEGGNIVLTSKSDRGNPSNPAEHASAISNGILEKLGAKARVASGIVVDEVRKDNELYRITLGGETEADRLCFNYAATDTDELAAFLLRDVEETTNNLFSAYNSAPIIPNGATTVVSGFPETTWGVLFADIKSGNTELVENPTTVTEKGDTHLMTAERLEGGGFLVVAGVTFFSTFEVKTELENAESKQNSNYQILLNILEKVIPETQPTPIAEVHSAELGMPFTIEGIATSNASGYDRDTAFFDCIYMQDDSGGINVFPVSGSIRAGQRIRVRGYTDQYNGERQLKASKVTVIDSAVGELPEPKEITTREAAEGTYLGMLVSVKGKVIDFTEANDLVESVTLRDASGVSARVFIDGYITVGKVIEGLEVGATFRATGFSSHDPDGFRIRISDRDNVRREDAEPAIRSVSVTTQTIVSTLSAWLQIHVEGDLEGRQYTAYLQVGDELRHPTPVVGGSARMFVDAAPAPGVYQIVVMEDGDGESASCTVEAVEYNTSIWTATSFVDEDGYLCVKFNAEMQLKKTVTVNGARVSAAVSPEDGSVLRLGLKAADLPDSSTIVVTGVKFPGLFPSYTFTYTVQHVE